MAQSPDSMRLPIDELPHIRPPEIIPVNGRKLRHFLKEFRNNVNVLEKWAKFHVKALSYHPGCHTGEEDSLIDDLQPEDLLETRNRLLERAVGIVREFDDYKRVDEPTTSQLRKKKTPWYKVIRKKIRRLSGGKEHQKDELDLELDPELDMEELKELPFDELRWRFVKHISEEVKRYRALRKDKEESQEKEQLPVTPLPKVNSYDEMCHLLQACKLAFKFLSMLRDAVEEFYLYIASFDVEVGPDSTITGKNALVLNNRKMYLEEAKCLAYSLVYGSEMDWFSCTELRNCVSEFVNQNKKSLKKEGPVERLVIDAMVARESILIDINQSPKRVQENIQKKSSEQNLLLGMEVEDTELGMPDMVPTESPAKKARLAKLGSPSSGFCDSSEEEWFKMIVAVTNKDINPKFLKAHK